MAGRKATAENHTAARRCPMAAPPASTSTPEEVHESATASRRSSVDRTLYLQPSQFAVRYVDGDPVLRSTVPDDAHNTPLGAYLRQQRELHEMSLRQLAELAGISNPYLSQIE